MPKKKPITKEVYAKRARELRGYGFNLSLRGNKNPTSQEKSSVSRAWNRVVFYVGGRGANEKRLDFHRFRGSASEKKWRSNIARERITPGGFFVQRPKGVKKGQYKISIHKEGGVKIKVRGKKVNDIEILLDMIGVARDPRAELQRVLKGHKRPREFLLTVNGYDASRFEDLEQFNRYLETDLIPHLERAEFNFEKWGATVFGLRLVYSGKGDKKTGGEGKAFDFESGGIFDESSKRVYGRKKYTDRKKWSIKKGKRKGT